MSEKIEKVMEEVKALTVLELNELVKALEEEFGVTAAAPVAAAGAAVAGAAAGAEQTEFTVVLKDAEVKIFLTASTIKRAQRRYLQNQQLNIASDLDQLIKEIEQRDYQDTHRAASPLVKASDAIEIDSSDLTIDEVIDKILEIVNRKVNVK